MSNIGTFLHFCKMSPVTCSSQGLVYKYRCQFNFWLQHVLLTCYYILWASRWFLSKKYMKAQFLKVLWVSFTCLTWLKHPPKLGYFSTNKKYHAWCLFMDIYVYVKYYWIFTKPLVFCFRNTETLILSLGWI